MCHISCLLATLLSRSDMVSDGCCFSNPTPTVKNCVKLNFLVLQTRGPTCTCPYLLFSIGFIGLRSVSINLLIPNSNVSNFRLVDSIALICSFRTYALIKTLKVLFMVLHIWTNISIFNWQFLIHCYHQKLKG